MLESREILLNGVSYTIKPQSIGALLTYEGIFKKDPEKIESLTDIVNFLYACLVSGNKNEPNKFVMKRDEFIDALDAIPNILADLDKVILGRNAKDVATTEGVDEKK